MRLHVALMLSGWLLTAIRRLGLSSHYTLQVMMLRAALLVKVGERDREALEVLKEALVLSAPITTSWQSAPELSAMVAHVSALLGNAGEAKRFNRLAVKQAVLLAKQYLASVEKPAEPDGSIAAALHEYGERRR